MDTKSDALQVVKPLAGHCKHQWENQESVFVVAQVCNYCKLYRYKPAIISDWEYRAPIPRVALEIEWP